MDPSCLACNINSGKITTPGGVIYQDEHWRVDHSSTPILLAGHLIIKPLRHVEHLSELTQQEMGPLGEIIRKTTLALTKVLHPEKVYLCSFGETVTHIHFHVIPRMNEMPNHGVDLLDELFKGKWKTSDKKASDITGKVKLEWINIQ